MTGWHDDGACVDLVDTFDFFFKCREGFFCDDDLDADFWSVALELFKSVKKLEVVMSLIDADVEVIDVFAVLFHGSFIKEVPIGGKEEVEWFLVGVLEDFTEVFSDERVSSLQT